MANFMQRAGHVLQALPTRLGRAYLRAAHGDKALAASVLTELVAGSSWFNGLPLTKLADFDSYFKAATRKVWALWKCADLKSGVCMGTPWKLVKKGGDGEDSEVQIPELESLLNEPNPWQTWDDLVYHTVMSLCVTGNAFWAKDQTNMKRQRPGELRVLNPKRMSIIVDVRSGVVGYVYRPVYAQDRADFSRPIPFYEDEIVHFRVPNPDNDFWGLGPVEAGEPLYNSHINYDTWLDAYWSRGATPTTLLVLKSEFPGGAAQFQAYKERFQKEYGGTDNAGKVAWLTGDWSRETMGLSLREMQAIEQREWDIRQIAMLNGVPLSVLGLENDANYSTARVSDVQFRKHTIKPILTRLAGQITRGLVRDYDPEAEFRFNLTGLVNVEEVQAVLLPMLQNGVVTPNEVRKEMEMEPVDDPLMDRHYMTAGLTPLDEAGIADLGLVDRQAQEVVDRARVKPKPIAGNGGNGNGGRPTLGPGRAPRPGALGELEPRRRPRTPNEPVGRPTV